MAAEGYAACRPNRRWRCLDWNLARQLISLLRGGRGRHWCTRCIFFETWGQAPW